MESRLAHKARFGWTLVSALAAGKRARHKAFAGVVDQSVRERGFLELIKEIWAREENPLRRLLVLAEWNPERVERSVNDTGLEATLILMAREGVYLDSQEVKCRVPLFRQGQRVPFSPQDLDFVSGPAAPLGTSGTSGPSTKNPLDLEGFQLQASYKHTMLEAVGAVDLPLVLYYPAPSAAGIAHLLSFSLAGHPPAAWFCHLPEARSAQRQWAGWLRALAVACRLRGVRLPLPELAEVEEPRPLLDWLVENAPSGAVLATFPGSALRLQAYADACGVTLPSLVWILGGEPVSPRKRQTLEERGHRVLPWYGAVDTGRIAIGCINPQSSDDMHFLTDRFAGLVWGEGAAPQQEGSGRLMLTSIDRAVHKLFLNVDCGDVAELELRSCGCPLARHGFDLHVSAVRSFEKLTLEGITLPADLVFELAEEALPATCGGTPADCQILEEEGEDGMTRLVVLVDPSLGADDAAIVGCVEEILERASGGADDMAERLRLGRAVIVRHERPTFSGGGKLLAVSRQGVITS